MIDETEKTAHFTLDLEEDTSYTIEQLIDDGQLDRVVFGGRLYELKDEVNPKSKGEYLGFIGQTHYVDQEGKRWTEEELKKPYVYYNPKDIREKQPLTYGSAYRYKRQPEGSFDLIIIELNKKLFQAKMVQGD
ncbi:NisI/SpaI family lantibiotic immunity lipoprotein [Paenibacillus sp. FSL W7-1332]|uniref:NisI/SpaI family lantibiotic immunity lipoprotein n=1 Tax=Paenibacillus sp. FSL W7-1332 TaxID=2921702 RepID=UPI0030CE7570